MAKMATIAVRGPRPTPSEVVTETSLSRAGRIWAPADGRPRALRARRPRYRPREAPGHGGRPLRAAHPDRVPAAARALARRRRGDDLRVVLRRVWGGHDGVNPPAVRSAVLKLGDAGRTGVHPHRARARLPHAETGTSRDRRRRPGAPKATVTLFVMHPPDPSSAGLPGALTSGWEEVCAPLAGWTAAGPRCVSLRRGRDRAAPAALRSPNLSLPPPAAGLGRPAAASGGPPVFERTLSSCPNTGTRTAAVIGAPATVHFGGSAASWRSSRR